MSQSIGELPPRSPPRRKERRSLSVSGGFPPSTRRDSAPNNFRPVPFASKYEQVNPGASGVSVLEHLERLDKVEAGLQRLRVGDSVAEENEAEEESTPRAAPVSLQQNPEAESVDVSSAHSVPESSRAAQERETAAFGLASSISERIASPGSPGGWANNLIGRSSMDSAAEGNDKRLVIMEVSVSRHWEYGALIRSHTQRLETVDSTAVFSC